MWGGKCEHAGQLWGNACRVCVSCGNKRGCGGNREVQGRCDQWRNSPSNYFIAPPPPHTHTIHTPTLLPSGPSSPLHTCTLPHPSPSPYLRLRTDGLHVAPPRLSTPPHLRSTLPHTCGSVLMGSMLTRSPTRCGSLSDTWSVGRSLGEKESRSPGFPFAKYESSNSARCGSSPFRSLNFPHCTAPPPLTCTPVPGTTS